jgi:glycosyltransferase involved in cell wall biosynthesis
VPEVVKHGETGFVVDTLDEMDEAIKKIDTISRVRCREWVMEKFTVDQMISGYEAVIGKVLKRG